MYSLRLYLNGTHPPALLAARFLCRVGSPALGAALAAALVAALGAALVAALAAAQVAALVASAVLKAALAGKTDWSPACCGLCGLWALQPHATQTVPCLTGVRPLRLPAPRLVRSGRQPCSPAALHRVRYGSARLRTPPGQ